MVLTTVMILNNQTQHDFNSSTYSTINLNYLIKFKVFLF